MQHNVSDTTWYPEQIENIKITRVFKEQNYICVMQ